MAPYTLNWGILATGGIAKTFSKDLLVPTSTRDAPEIQHEIVAAASSSSLPRAQQFLHDISAPSTATPYGSYAELIADPSVQVIYIATPHSQHYENALACLRGGKHVLCEKSVTVNAAQARELVVLAREKGLFFMEAVWTRFFPLSIKVRELVKGGVVGEVKRVQADLSLTEDHSSGSNREGDRVGWDDAHRMVNPSLAGGALLDLGIYALTWTFQILYHCQPGTATSREKPKVMAAINKYDATGVDEETAIVLQFPRNKSMGIATTSLRCRSFIKGFEEIEAAGPSIRIFGSSGEIQVFGPAFKPVGFKVFRSGSEKGEEIAEGVREGELVRFGFPGGGHGMFWEADEVARCVRDGRLESEVMGWEESVAIMEVMDEVRRQGGLKYPEEIEKV